MNIAKDTIYIDVEDDITAIIGKVKAAKTKIVALVPPKRVGVLQSAVNLRLLARAAKQSDKHLVLISGNTALTALAASASIPSARTLQSKPELAPMPETSDDPTEDIIDGADLPVGDLARTDGEDLPQAVPAVDSAIRANSAEEVAAAPLARPHPKPRKNSIKVPNFDTFRKKLALGVGGLFLLIVFLVWAIWFAPNAKIIITARTIESSANPKVTLTPSSATDATASSLKVTQQQVKKEAALAFDATGSKEVGEKAKGEVVFQNCESLGPITIAAGTGIGAGGKTYLTQAAVTVPGGTGGFGGCSSPGTSSPVTVVAQNIGEDYNVNKNTQFSVAGHPNSSSVLYFRAVASNDITGGSKRNIKVVTREDIEKATDQLVNQSIDEVKKQLITAFGDGVITIDATFAVGRGEVASAPAVDQEAPDGKAKLTGALVFTMFGAPESETGRFLDAYFAKQIKDSKNQRIYSNGVDKTTFVDVVAAADGAYTATMTATAKFGPKIDDAAVKAQAKGKRFGEVQSAIEQISGVESVDVKFSPFWVKTVPKDEKRITIEFNLDESK